MFKTKISYFIKMKFPIWIMVSNDLKPLKIVCQNCKIFFKTYLMQSFLQIGTKFSRKGCSMKILTDHRIEVHGL